MSGNNISGFSFQGSDLRDLVFGSDAGDSIDGGGGNDILFGRGGDDDIAGGAGHDLLFGGRGDDGISGGESRDVLFGGRGDDDIQGDAGDDLIFGGRGDDDIVWNNGDGSDLVFGGRGDDTQIVNASDDAGDNFVLSSFGSLVNIARTNLGTFDLDLISIENLVVNTQGGDDRVTLENDVLNRIEIVLDGGADTADDAPAVSGADIATGDTIDLSHLTSGVRVDLDENNQGVLQDDVIVDDVNVSDGTAPGLSEFGNIQIDGEIVVDALNDFENVIGTDFDDTIFGNAQNNVLQGGDGDDALHPFGGEDYVNGGAGTDVLLLNGFANGQFVDMVAGLAGDLNADADGIAEGASLNTFRNIENINGSSVAGDVIFGDDGVNVLNGLGGNDVLDGGAGNDVLIGGTGDADLLTGGADSDTFVFANGDGNGSPGSADQIQDFSTAEDLFGLNAESFGLNADAELVFANAARIDDGADPAGLDDSLDPATFDAAANVYVLQGAFANAGAARNAIAEARVAAQGDIATEEDEAGFFIYFNEAQGRNRLFAVEDLDEVNGSIQQIANLGGTLAAGDPGRDAALDQLALFSADNFTFELA
ncbi:MAG: calcium-binding protein [Pseudomonadota bacterium]